MNHSINAKHNPSTQEIQLLKICMYHEQSQQKVHNKRDKNSIRWKHVRSSSYSQLATCNDAIVI